MKFEELYRLVMEEQNIIDPQETNWSTKDATSVVDMANSIMQGNLIDWQMRNAGYTPDDIKKYFKMRQKGATHGDALKQIPPPKAKEIDYQDPEVQKKIKQAFIKMGYNTQEDMDVITDLLKPERINSLKASMLANRMDISKILQESFKKSIMTDDKGIKRSVEAVVKFAEKNKDKYFKKQFSIKKLEHELKWWNEQNKANPKKSNKRMMKSDTSYPLLVIKNKSYGLSVSDGLNRLKKAKDVENKKNIDVYIVPEEDIPDSTIIED
jgi:hypothetical protein